VPTPLTDEQIFCLADCDEYEKYRIARQDFERDVCTFCEPDPILNDVLFEDPCGSPSIVVWHAHEQFKRKDLLWQFLIVPTRHVRFPWELNGEENHSVFVVNRWLNEHFELRGGMFFARFGDMRLNAGTIPHLHWNLWVPLEGSEVRIPISKGMAHRDRNRERMAWFAEQYEAEKKLEGA